VSEIVPKPPVVLEFEPAPEPLAEPVLEPEPAPALEPAPDPIFELESELTPTPVFALVPKPPVVLEFEPAPELAPEPEPPAEPAPELAPEPEPPAEPAPAPQENRAAPAEAVVIKRKERRFVRETLEVLVIIVLAVVVTTLLRVFVIDNYEIPTGSMEPTIEIGDRLFAEKVTYRISAPRRGDIVTFNDPSEAGRVLIKRCIATGGQVVDLQDGRVIVDGIILDEPYTHDKPSLPLSSTLAGVDIKYPYTVPEGSIWVMGDNRTSSSDSRYFGAVPDEELIGKALFRFLPLDRFGAIE
jgi:signal peptidase I